MKHWLRHPTLTLAISAALAFASGTAAALGLGQIEVRSRAGEPLLAEIPVISTTPGEIEQLQARLASPETFARIGLQPPEGVLTDLRFEVAYNRAGRPVIRVTTDQPIRQPLLTFLVEVDWGQGRLVREYSALVDAPRAVAAPVQPPIQAPVAAPSNTIQRPVAAPQRPLPLPVPVPAPQRPSSKPAAPPQPPAAPDAPGEYGPVKKGETLSAIATRFGLADGATLDQAMIAVLRANPDAFIGGDINQLKRGAVLRMPQAAEVAAVDAAQAAQIVRDRMRQWRDARRQAVIASEEPVEAAQAPGRSEPKSERQAPAAKSTRPPPAAGARLEIVPPAADRATQAGTQSGIQAGGEGQMLQQELQQTRETLAARDAELQELKSRVAELEKLQSDQQRLIAMKNAELAAAQQRLSSQTEAAPAAAAPAAEVPAGGSWLPWLLGGAAALALLFGWWWSRRRPATQSPFRSPQRSAASDLAAAFPLRREPAEDLLVVQPNAADDGVVTPVVSSHADTHQSPEPEADEHTVHEHRNTAEVAEPSVMGMRGGEAWEGPDLAHEDAELPEDVEVAPPAWHTPAAAAIPPVAPVAPTPLVEPTTPRLEPAVEAPVNERIELAQAYLDLGDYDSARQLLGEVVINGDHASRQRALRMLRELE